MTQKKSKAKQINCCAFFEELEKILIANGFQAEFRVESREEKLPRTCEEGEEQAYAVTTSLWFYLAASINGVDTCLAFVELPHKTGVTDEEGTYYTETSFTPGSELTINGNVANNLLKGLKIAVVRLENWPALSSALGTMVSYNHHS